MNKYPSSAVVLLCLAASLVAARCSRSVPENQLQLGIWAAENNLWGEALFRWKKEVEVRPRSAAAHNNLAVALEKNGQWEEARKEYELAVKLEPENAQIKMNYQKFKENLEPPDKDKDKDKKEKGTDEKK
jgi:Flp pilus assembly protein TadD